MLIENLTGEEIMHYTALFCYNWVENDFRVAFADSHLGWDYYYNKLQAKIQAGADPADAILSTVLNMDNTHKPMLYYYLFSEKYTDQIKQSRQLKNLIVNNRNKNNKPKNR